MTNLSGETKPPVAANATRPVEEAQKMRVVETTESGLLTPGETTLVNAPGKTGASYHLFIPPSYGPTNQNVPLIFAFSPSGDGKAILRQLRPAGTARGWIVVGCNQLQNKWHPGDRLREREIILDVRRRVPHDRTREYLAGFSGGGARAYGLTRHFWNEFAGVIAYCGWLARYEPELVYPGRLAVAMVNGDRDLSALRRAKSDAEILDRFGIRTTEFQFAGGHGIGPPEVTRQAFKWLDTDWQQHQRETTERAIRESARLLALAKTAMQRGHMLEALAGASRIVLDYGFVPEAAAADELLVKIFSSATTRKEAVKHLGPLTNAVTAQMFLARARSLDGFPPQQRVGYCELAWALNSGNVEAAAQLAAALADWPDATPADLARAEQLAAFAVRQDPSHWYGWNGRALVAVRNGQPGEARTYWQKAVDVSPSWAKPYCESHLKNLSP